MRAFNSLFGRQGQSSATARAIKNASACLVEPLEDRALFSISIFELGTMAEDRTGLALQASVPVQAAQAPISKLPIVAAPPIPNGHTPTSKVPDDIFELDASSMSALQGLPGLSGVQFNGCTDIEIAVTIPANELESTPTSAESLIDAFKKSKSASIKVIRCSGGEMETAASTALKTPTPTVQEKARPVNPVKTQSDVQGSGTTAPRSPESRPTLMVDEQFGTAPIKPESIGGNTNAAGNAISGNMTEGVKLDNGATQKRVNGNQIGVASVPNEKSGVPNVKSPLNCVGTVGGTKKGSSIRQDPTPAPRPLFPPTLMIDERFGAVPAVNPKGFIVNAHSAPFSVTVFGFDPQRISAPAP